jgi:hypothetical protein
LGLGTTDQLVPFQDSMRVLGTKLTPMLLVPTAVQAAAETQDTPERGSPSDPRLGLGTTDQLAPFQDSMRVLGRRSVLSALLPTAVQAAAETQDTPERPLALDPGLGLGTTVQLVPFHDSTRVVGLSLLLP